MVSLTHGIVPTYLSDITGPEPAVIGETLLGNIGPLVVASSDGTSSQPNFSLGRVIARQVVGLGVVVKLDLERGHDAPDCRVLLRMRVFNIGRCRVKREVVLTWKNPGVKTQHIPQVSVAPVEQK